MRGRFCLILGLLMLCDRTEALPSVSPPFCVQLWIPVWYYHITSLFFAWVCFPRAGPDMTTSWERLNVLKRTQKTTKTTTYQTVAWSCASSFTVDVVSNSPYPASFYEQEWASVISGTPRPEPREWTNCPAAHFHNNEGSCDRSKKSNELTNKCDSADFIYEL